LLPDTGSLLITQTITHDYQQIAQHHALERGFLHLLAD